MAVNQLKAGVVLSYIGMAVGMITGLLYTPYMLHRLGQAEYGIFSLASSVIGYLSLLDFGFGNAVVRYIARFRALGDSEGEARLTGTFCIVYSIIGLVAFIGGMGLYLNVDNMFGDTMTPDELDQTRWIMLLMAVNLSVSFPFSVFGSVIRAHERFVFARVVALVLSIISTLASVAVLMIGYKALGLVVASTVFNVIGIAINYYYFRGILKLRVRYGGFNWGVVKEISIYSFWIFLNMIMDKIYWSTGQFVLGVKVGTIAIAIYAVAITLQSIYMSFSTGISSVILPRLSAMVASSASDKEFTDFFIKTGRLQFIIMALITSGFIVFGHQFIILWAGAEYAEAFPMTLLFIIGLFIPLIQNTGITILQARNQMRFRSLLYLAISLCTLGAQILLAPRYAGFGCAVAICVALLFGQGLVMNIYYYKKQRIDIPLFWYNIGKMAVVPVIMTCAGCILMRYVRVDNYMALLGCILVFVAVYVPLFWQFAMNDYERETLGAPLMRCFPRLSRR